MTYISYTIAAEIYHAKNARLTKVSTSGYNTFFFIMIISTGEEREFDDIYIILVGNCACTFI